MIFTTWSSDRPRSLKNQAEVLKCESSLTRQVDVGHFEGVEVDSSHATEDVEIADLDGGGVLDVVVGQRIGDPWR